MARKDRTASAPAETPDVRTREGEPVENVADALIAESEREQQAENQLGQDEQETPQTGSSEAPKRKRGRPAGSKTGTKARTARTRDPAASDGQPEAPAMTAEQLQEQATLLAPVLYGFISPFVDRRNPDRPYKMEEAMQLSAAIIPVSMKYGDSLFMAYKEEIALTIVLLGQMMPRMQPTRIADAPFTVVASSAPETVL